MGKKRRISDIDTLEQRSAISLDVSIPVDDDRVIESINEQTRSRIDQIGRSRDRLIRDLIDQRIGPNELRGERDDAAGRHGVSPKDLSSRKLLKTLQERERAGLAVDELLNRTIDYIYASSSASKLGDHIGMIAARAYILQKIEVHGGEILVDGDRGEHTLDIVAVIGNPRHPLGLRLLVVEAKGGDSAELGTREVYDANRKKITVRQGTREYLEDLLRTDVELYYKLLDRYPKLHKALVDRNANFVEYLEIKADRFDSTAPSPSRISAWEFDMGSAPLGFSGVDPVTPKAVKQIDKARDERINSDRSRLAQNVRSRILKVGSAGVVVVGMTGGAQIAGAIVGAGPSSAATSTGEFLSATNQLAGDDALISFRAKASELGRMLSSFKDYVQNGLNRLATMAGDAAAKMSAFVSDVVDSAKAQELIDKVSDDWAFAQELLNIAMLFSPVGTVAAAISAAVPIIQLIVEHWDQIRAAFDWVLKNVLTPVAEFFMTAFKVYIAPYRLAFDAVMAGFNGMGGVVGSAVGAVRSTVVGIVKAIGQIFQRLEINIGFPVNRSFGLKSVGDAMVAWASERLADGGLVGGQRGSAPGRASGIEVMAVIDRSVLRATQAEERKIGYAYRPPFLHDGALPRTDNGPGPRTFDVRVADVDAAFAQIRMLQAVQDARFSPVGV
ncbi:hypothetical protein [Nocardia salmonicida]|uniref:hypothetical protein n=1 Tax=Nocardia salmonicida TaxID=53431 RepID=UPI0033EE27F0